MAKNTNTILLFCVNTHIPKFVSIFERNLCVDTNVDCFKFALANYKTAYLSHEVPVPYRIIIEINWK